MSSTKSISVPLLGQWNIQKVKTDTGEVLYEETSENVVVKVGRGELLKLIFNLSGSTFLFMAAGPCSTAATVNDTKMTYEHILNATRKSLTNTSDVALTAGDVVDETTVVSGVTYYKKIVVRTKYLGVSDSNVNHPFQEYGLFSTATLPGTPTGASGNMLNHYVAASPIVLDNLTTLIINLTLRA